MIGPLSYIGGKRRLAPLLISLFPRHVTYVEPFCGGAQVFFHKPRSRVEVLNDLDSEIVNFLRICREHPAELIRTLEFLVPSRAVFAQFAEQNPALLTDIQRAARFLYLQKNAFGGLRIRRHYHVCVSKPPNFSPGRLPQRIAETATRLRYVQLEQLPYDQILRRYDRPTTLFYLDPPYIGINLYRYNLPNDAFVSMATQLRQLKGKFLLSINDCAHSRAVFAGFTIRECSLVYTASRSVPTARELLVSNFDLPTTAS
jgi:DNA adenine methylase